MKGFEEQLTGGHPNSLGNTEKVVEQVLNHPEDLEELYNCYFSDNEIVRLRVSSAMKRVCMAQKELVIPYLDRLLNEISKIDQASAQWTLAILFELLKDDMTEPQLKQARDHLTHNLEHHHDWIVLNTTMETLGKWAKTDESLKKWMLPQLERISLDDRKSVSNKAKKWLKAIS